MDRLTDQIIALEWRAFQQVDNEGGRAGCQDDLHNFQIMRGAQFSVWPEPVRKSYLEDLQQAERNGENLVEQKYAWMMSGTAPEEFARIRDSLPALSLEKQSCIGEILKIQVPWMTAFARRYPGIASRGREPEAESDSPYATSGATYLRGELSTYSERTLKLYLDFVRQAGKDGRNLQTEITEKMVELKGYRSLEQVEKTLRKA